MNDVLAVFVALAIAFATSELALRGTKLQTGLVRVLVVWACVFAGLVAYMLLCGNTGVIVCTLLWGGTFLSWFGVRSHIESSILMRMMYLLRKKPMSGPDLVNEYESHYGEALRREELFRGNLLANEQQPQITPKGRAILWVVSLLR